MICKNNLIRFSFLLFFFGSCSESRIDLDSLYLLNQKYIKQNYEYISKEFLII